MAVRARAYEREREGARCEGGKKGKRSSWTVSHVEVDRQTSCPISLGITFRVLVSHALVRLCERASAFAEAQRRQRRSGKLAVSLRVTRASCRYTSPMTKFVPISEKAPFVNWRVLLVSPKGSPIDDYTRISRRRVISSCSFRLPPEGSWHRLITAN